VEGSLQVPLSAPVRRTAYLTGVSITTVSSIQRSTSRRLRKKRSDSMIFDDFDRCVVRRTVNEMMATHQILPTIGSLSKILQEKIGFKGSRETLRRLLHELGFKWQTLRSNRRVLTEKPDIINKRIQFLREMSRTREQGRPVVYMDETYIQASHSPRKGWQSEEIKHHVPIGKGERLIIVHAGSETGFVPNAGLIFKSKSKSGDYHDDMNFNNYKKWLEEMLIPNLPANSCVVIDNASYHNVQVNRCPTSSTKKAEIQAWLTENGIPFGAKFLKPELLELCKRYKQQPRYVVNQMLESHGHKCIRLPPYHADLNPIELIWSNVKGKVSKKNFTFKLNAISALAEEAINSVTPEEWKKCCEHVKKLEQEYWARDVAVDAEVERVEFDVCSSDSATDTASDSTSYTDSADEYL